MTDNEIIKALECCQTNKCDECPVYKECHATEKGRVNVVLDLINRQKAEIAELQLKINVLESDLRLKTYDYEHLLMKCKEIQAISSSRKDRLMQTVINLQTAKSEAVKEFAKEFVADLSHMLTYDKDYIKAKIFHLVEMKAKEMKGGEPNA